MKETVELAKSIAEKAHTGQLDKGRHEYILHPQTVASLVESDEEKIVAWLHDTVEDSSVTLKDLTNHGFSDEIIYAIDAITKKPGQSYDEYIEQLKENSLAVRVKISDLTHNSDISRIPNPSQKDFERILKYSRLKEYLMNELADK